VELVLTELEEEAQVDTDFQMQLHQVLTPQDRVLWEQVLYLFLHKHIRLQLEGEAQEVTILLLFLVVLVQIQFFQQSHLLVEEKALAVQTPDQQVVEVQVVEVIEIIRLRVQETPHLLVHHKVTMVAQESLLLQIMEVVAEVVLVLSEEMVRLVQQEMAVTV
jgi:hypothetical protein